MLRLFLTLILGMCLLIGTTFAIPKTHTIAQGSTLEIIFPVRLAQKISGIFEGQPLLFGMTQKVPEANDPITRGEFMALVTLLTNNPLLLRVVISPMFLKIIPMPTPLKKRPKPELSTATPTEILDQRTVLPEPKPPKSCSERFQSLLNQAPSSGFPTWKTVPHCAPTLTKQCEQKFLKVTRTELSPIPRTQSPRITNYFRTREWKNRKHQPL